MRKYMKQYDSILITMTTVVNKVQLIHVAYFLLHNEAVMLHLLAAAMIYLNIDYTSLRKETDYL